MRSLAADDVGTTNNREATLKRMGNFTTHIRAASQVGCPTLNTVRSDDLPTLFALVFFGAMMQKRLAGYFLLHLA